MGHETWKNGELCFYSGRKYDSFGTYSRASTRSRAPIWITLWRRIKKGKKRSTIVSQYCSSSTRFTYDPYTYSQNFDQGLMWADSDDLNRSFSARFAVPSRIFEKNNCLMV
ncbi:hypothetical protein ABFX02_04G102400 [Erythranthe guttata]